MTCNSEIIEIVFPENEENVTWVKRKRHEIWSSNFKSRVFDTDLSVKKQTQKAIETDFSSEVQKLKEKVTSLEEIKILETKINVNYERCNKDKLKLWKKDLNELKQRFCKTQGKSSMQTIEGQKTEVTKLDNDSLVKDINKIRRYVINKEAEIKDLSKSSKKTQIIETLKEILSIINENESSYNDAKTVYDTRKRINSLINSLENKHTNSSRNNFISKNGFVYKTKPSHIKSQRGLQVEQVLNEIKPKMKIGAITEEERNEIFARLIKLKGEISNNIHTFTNVDNINGRLTQIEQYCYKLKNWNSEKNKPSVNKQPADEEKHKMKTIWSFSLSAKK